MTNHPEQSRAARLALHCPIRTNTISKLRPLWWLTLENRLLFNTTTFFRNTIFSFQPVFLCNHIVRCSQVHSHFTRSADDSQMMLPSPKSNALKKTVIYCAINHWNNCPLNIQELNCKLSFKYLLRMHYVNVWVGNGHTYCMNAIMIVTMNVITFDGSFLMFIMIYCF